MKRELIVLTTIVLAGVAGWAVTTAVAGELHPPPGPIEPTMKTLEQVEARMPVQSLAGSLTASYVIDQPGSYYLIDNIIGEPGKHGIEIAAHDVTVDLNGFTMTGLANSGDDAHGIYVTLADCRNLCIHGGSIYFWNLGVHAEICTNGHFHDTRVYDCGVGMRPGKRALVERLLADGCFDGFQSTSFCTFVECQAKRGWSGFWCHGEGNTFVRCSVESAGLTAFAPGEGSLVLHCNVRDSNQGIGVGDGSTVRDCNISSTWGVAISAGSRCVIADNNCNDNRIGVVVSNDESRTRIERNTVSDCDEIGFQVTSPGNFIVSNVALNNTVDYDIAAGNTMGELIDLTGGIVVTSGNPWANFGVGCLPGLDFCDGQCVDTETDPDHCGGCGVECLPEETCVSGECQ